MTADLQRQIEKAAEVLKSFGAREVYLFGSAAADKMDEDSDIDMAVSGLPPEVFFRAWAKAVREFPGREMDLVSLDKGGPFAEFLRDKGRLRRVG
jgi:predicted nucleotidyltransferase